MNNPKDLSVDHFLSRGNSTVLLDVRTPDEYAQGHIPNAHSFPLFTNEERAIVGTIYKRQGREKAIEKGLDFVGPRLGEFVRNAKQLVTTGQSIHIYCWRGGMRSGSMAWLLRTAGMDVQVLHGGYQSFRRNFQQLLQNNVWDLRIIGGGTGCRKTELLAWMEQSGEQVLDLEAMARHRGSAFGGIGMCQQPTSEQFVNDLQSALLTKNPSKPVWIECESASIGSVFLPSFFFERMLSAPLYLIQCHIDERVDTILSQYGDLPKEQLQHAFVKIERRMGSDRVKTAIEAINNGDLRTAIHLAIHYYDKTYEESLLKKWNVCATIDAQNKSFKQIFDQINLTAQQQ